MRCGPVLPSRASRNGTGREARAPQRHRVTARWDLPLAQWSGTSLPLLSRLWKSRSERSARGLFSWNFSCSRTAEDCFHASRFFVFYPPLARQACLFANGNKDAASPRLSVRQRRLPPPSLSLSISPWHGLLVTQSPSPGCRDVARRPGRALKAPRQQGLRWSMAWLGHSNHSMAWLRVSTTGAVPQSDHCACVAAGNSNHTHGVIGVYLSH